ncbi:intraflagellar transport protein 20 homolog [Cylas formicarius]|uniref:intraflagellar transport protein 20 homolog n=1 Tax=Cylas formicarius TaxID=197179 RepID=UPI00295857A7|nr:intraflagellar transport protein 20 homolog [Cylas formicarius]
MANLLGTGIFFNEVNDKICILDPETYKLANDLKEECQIYIEKIDEFRRIATKFISLEEELGSKIEKQKLKALRARNLLQSMKKQRDNSHQQVQAVIAETSMTLERLKAGLASLEKAEMEQIGVINQLTN